MEVLGKEGAEEAEESGEGLLENDEKVFSGVKSRATDGAGLKDNA